MISQHSKQRDAYNLAKEYIGLKEIVGSRHEAKIVEFFEDVGHSWVKDDETAWCAAFVGAMLERSGLPSTRKLNARSYGDWGVAVPLDKAEPGDLVYFERGDSSWQGHVGFYVGQGKSYISVLGGNQANAVSIAAYSKDKFLGVRRYPAPALTFWQRILSWFGWK